MLMLMYKHILLSDSMCILMSILWWNIIWYLSLCKCLASMEFFCGFLLLLSRYSIQTAESFEKEAQMQFRIPPGHGFDQNVSCNKQTCQHS